MTEPSPSPRVVVCPCGIVHRERPLSRAKRRGPYCCDVCLCGREVVESAAAESNGGPRR